MAGYRMPYSIKEENAILKYIVEKEIYNRLRGRAVWQDLEATERVKRTWQSAKEHFRQKMLRRVLTDDRFELTQEQRQNIYNGWTRSGAYLNNELKNKGKGHKSSKNTVEYDHGMTSSEDEEAPIIEVS